MRVCMLVRNSCTRDARVLREAAALAEAGHRVLVIAMREAGVPHSESRDGFTIERIPPVPLLRRPVIPPSSPAPVRSPQPDPRAPTRRSPVLYAVRDRLVSFNLTRAALARPADVYHAHDLNTLSPAVRAARRHRARLVYDSHELYPEISGLSEQERRRWRRLEGRLVSRADHIITVSESIADELMRRYDVARPLVLMNVPLRAAVIDVSRPPLASLRRSGKMMVLYSGGISANRGIEQLAEAAEEARGWHLVIMGWGRQEREIRRQFPAVDFVDPVPPYEVVGAAAGADVGVIPYLPTGLNNTLSLPNKLFEYVQAGLAVVTSDLVELARFVHSNAVGLVFPPGDTTGILTALDALAADPGRLAKMRSAARAAATRFNWENERTKLIDAYERLQRGRGD